MMLFTKKPCVWSIVLVPLLSISTVAKAAFVIPTLSSPLKRKCNVANGYRFFENPSEQHRTITSLNSVVTKKSSLDDIASKLSSISIEHDKQKKTARDGIQVQYELMKSDRLQKRFRSRMDKFRKLKGESSKMTQFLCDSTVAICIASNQWESALEVLDDMRKNNITQELSTYKACLKECLEATNGVSALEVFDAMKQNNYGDNESLQLVVKTTCRSFKYDRSLWRKGMKTLHDNAGVLEEGGKAITVDTYNAILSCMEEERLWKESIQLLNQMKNNSRKQGANSPYPKPNLSSFHIVIHTFILARETNRAVDLLLQMNEDGYMPNVYTFDLVMLPLARTRNWRKAVQLLDLMDDLKVPQSTEVFNLGISACAKARELNAASELFNKMRKRKVRPDTITFNTLIDACAKKGLWKNAMILLRECENDSEIQPDIITYTNTIRACARSKRTNQALSLLETVKEKNLQLDAYVYTAVIDACSRGKMWRKALSLLDEMKNNGINPTGVTYSVAISACGNSGQWEQALNLLDQMKQNNMEINVITYNSAIAALAKASRQLSKSATSTSSKDLEEVWLKALSLLQQMRKERIQLDAYSYSAAISACAPAGRWQEALKLIKQMEQGGPKVKPNNIAYTSAISACARSGEWEHALDLFNNMKKGGVQPDRVCYNTLLSAFMNSGKHNEAFNLWNTMNRNELENNKSSGGKNKSVNRKKDITPDIITITEVIGCLHSSLNKQNIARIDMVFEEAVKSNIILSEDSMDTLWEIDLSGMSLPVARAACRYIMKRILDYELRNESIEDLSLITGVGKAQQTFSHSKDESLSEQDINEDIYFSNNEHSDPESPPINKKNPFGTTALREYVRQLLRDDFTPSIYSSTPNLAAGVVQVDKVMIQNWIDHQKL